jgi:hypothetical protein
MSDGFDHVRDLEIVLRPSMAYLVYGVCTVDVTC